MARKISAEPEVVQPVLELDLSYVWLYARVQEFAAQSISQSADKAEHLAFWCALSAAGLGLLTVALSPRFISPSVAGWIAAMFLFLEAVGLVVFVVLLVRRELPKLRQARKHHAVEMDGDFRRWQELLAKVSKFEAAQREARLRFAQKLRTSMTYRMGLALGGVERLGVFPVLVALYLQFREWRWGDWAAAFDVNLFAGLLIWMMVLLYGAGWLLVGLRIRLDTYIDLLEESLQHK